MPLWKVIETTGSDQVINHGSYSLSAATRIAQKLAVNRYEPSPSTIVVSEAN